MVLTPAGQPSAIIFSNRVHCSLEILLVTSKKKSH